MWHEVSQFLVMIVSPREFYPVLYRLVVHTAIWWISWFTTASHCVVVYNQQYCRRNYRNRALPYSCAFTFIITTKADLLWRWKNNISTLIYLYWANAMHDIALVNLIDIDFMVNLYNSAGNFKAKLSVWRIVTGP